MSGSNDSRAVHLRSELLTLAQAALAAVQGGSCVADALRAQPLSGKVHVIAIGKAAAAMTQGAHAVLGDRLARALVVTKTGHGDAALAKLPQTICLEAGHPVPDARSLAAGKALLEFIAAAPSAAELLLLISGGASSLVEVLPEGVTLDDLQRANTWLLGSGLDIAAMNRVRSALSAIKGGRLATHLHGRTARVLLISDVRGDDPAVIGSGLLVRDTQAPQVLPDLPDWLRTLCERALPPVAPTGSVSVRIVARLATAMQAAAREAQQLGHAVHVHEEFLCGDAVTAGKRLARELLGGADGVQVWGGETVVQLPPQPGRGGRNQTLALTAAQELQGHEGVALLALGTDGTDGPTEDAGGLVDGGTVARGEQEGLDVQQCLAAADAGTFLEASGDLVHTGPTGTNVMDLVIGVKL